MAWRNALLIALVATLGCQSSIARKKQVYDGGKPHRHVVPLNKDIFDDALKDNANPLWLLKFFAPWCGHCKRLAPVLDSVAPQVVGKMAVGTIDCTVEKSLCNQFQVRGYPTLKFSLDGETMDYTGSRKEEDLVRFAEKLNRPAVTLVNTYEEAMEYASTQSDEGVAFVAYHPKANGPTMELRLASTTLTQTYAIVARKQLAYAHFAVLDADADITSFVTKEQLEKISEKVSSEAGDLTVVSTGFICRLEDGVANRCVLENEGVETLKLLEFIKAANVALVSRLGPENFHKVGRKGRPLVIGAVDGQNQDQIKNVTAQLKKQAVKDKAQKYYFAWMDGKQWSKFLKQFKVNSDKLPQFFILDVPEKTYWHHKDISRKKLSEFMKRVKDGTVPRSIAGGRAGKIMATIGEFVADHMILSVLLMLALIGGIVYALVPKLTDDGVASLHSGGTGSGMGSVDPLLGESAKKFL